MTKTIRGKMEVVLCLSCKGKGHIDTDVLVDYHKHDYETHRSECHNCKGSGRLWQTTTVTYEAFK